MTTAALVLGMGVGTATAATAFTKAPVPTISGTVKVGSTLTAAAGTWSPSATLSYQWKRNGTSISGATAKTYKLTTSDAGRTVAVTTTGKRSGYTTTSKTSAGTAVPTVAFTTAPTPTISGTSSVGSTLTATAGTWSPTATVSYQWRRNGTAIASATAKTYKLATADAGQKLTVTVTGKRTGYTTTAKTSAAKTIATLTFGTAPTPTISGTASVGSTLTANPGTWSPTATLSFQWKRSGAAISGATAKTYKLVAADAGASITVTVTGKKTGYTTAAKTSAAKTIAATAFTTAPTPTISGTATVGSTLTANPGTWSPAATLTYQWKRNGSSISGAAAATYKLADADAGQSLTVTVTGARAGYATTARTSAAKAIPALAFTAAPTPTITGTAAVGSILTANAGTWSPTPTLAYQWNRNGIAISGATKTTYALVSADQGAMITVTVTASRSGYASTTRTSAVVTVPTGPGAAVVQISADITADTTWAPASSTVYLLTTQVDVRSGVTLTIGANAIVKARTNAGLAVEGALVVNGTAGNPVTFTSLRDDTIGGDSNSDGDVTTPQPGDWYGITISSKASMTATYATVKYASSGWQSSGADVFRLSHGAVSDTQYDGIRVAADRSGANAGNAIISITDTTVRRAGRNGITVSATGQPAGSGTQIPVPVVTDNTVTDSGKGYNNSSVPNQVAIRVHGYALDGSKLTGNDGNGNKISAIALSGTLKTNLSLPQGDLPLALLDSDYLTVAAGATLTIAAGQTVKAYQAGLAVEGSLVVNGTAGNPVTFTSLRDDTIGGDSNSDGDVTTPQPGDWYGITISSKASMTATYATVKYASSGWQSSGADVFRLSHGAVSDTQYDGIRVAADRSGANAGNAIISITDTTVRRAGRNGITVSATGQPAGSGTQIPVPVVTDNTVTDSGKGYNNSSVPNQVAIRVHGYALDGSKLTGNDGNGNKISAIALSGTLKTNLSLPQGDLPLALLDSDYLTVAAGATLTIAAGQTVKAYQAGLAVEGSLVVNGTAGNPVTFTSLRDDTIGGDSNSDGDVTTPQPGDWYGITISSKASMTATYATVKYASSGWQSSGADVFRLSHGAVSDTQYDGIRVAADRSGANAGNAIISITDTTVRRAGRNGITVSATGQPAGSGTQIPVPVVTDNTVTDSGKGYNNSSVPNQVAIRVHGYALDGSKLTGNDGNGNKISAIALSGTLKTNLSLPQGDLPLALLDSDYLTVAAGATLTIAAGQTVKAYQAGLAVEGSLVVNGTAGNPVTFTSLRDDTIGGDSNSDGDVTTPQPGDWYGITISNGGSVHGSGLSVRYASYGITAGQTSSLQLSDSGVSSTTSRCLDVTGADSASYFHGTVRDCEFGVFSSGLTYFDASAVDWGGDEPPGNGADERPRASGPGVDVFPWVGWVDPPPASKPKVYAASPCKDLLVIGVRGSGEEATSANRDMGNMVKTFHDAFVEELAEQSASPISTRTIGLEYPAYAVPLSSPDAPGLLTYTSGAWSGAVELMSTLENEIERCGSSGEKIVLNGYSQGAWVIHSTLAYMEKSKRLPVSNLAAVNLIADPQRAQLGAEYNAGSATGDTWGVANAQVVGVPAVRFSNWLAGSIYPEVRQFQASNVSSEDMITPVDIPTSLLSRVVTICNFTDPVCAIGGRGFPDADVHGEYPTSSGWARFVEESASTARIYAD